MDAKAKCPEDQGGPDRKHFRDRAYGQAELRGRTRNAGRTRLLYGLQCSALFIYFVFSCSCLGAQDVKIMRKATNE